MKALIRTAHEMGMEPSLLEAVESVNERQKRVLFGKLSQRLGQNLRGRQVAAWGLSFKAETDDMRESPALSLIDAILEAGASVRAHDPKAMEAAREVYGSGSTTPAIPTMLAGADALVIVTEWLVYRNPDFDRMRSALRTPSSLTAASV